MPLDSTEASAGASARSMTTIVWNCADSPENTPLLVEDPVVHAEHMERLRGYLDLAAELRHPGERLTVSTTSGGDPDDWERGKGILIDRAVATQDEHAIKFTEACLREHAFNPKPLYLQAARDAVGRF